MNAFFQRYALGVALILLFLVGISGYFMIVFREQAQAQAEEKELLAAQLREINEEQKTAIITRRVSSQLEEIAYQQKAISDAQKLEAENQKLIAEQMRDHAELEREKAIVAQQAALEAYEEMDAQKRIAEQRRAEAVMAQMRADSLARLALARSLGVQATKQYEADNEPLAALLSYAAWKFTAENQGDLYSPDIYKALSLCCKLSRQWRIHRGAVRSILSYSQAGHMYLLTASQYGEIYRWTLSGNLLTDRITLFNNQQYDVRLLYEDKINLRLFALCQGGQLLIISSKDKVEIKELPLSQPVGMANWEGQIAIASKKGDLRVVTPDSWATQTLYQHPCAITALTVAQGELLIGDEKGRVYQIDHQGKAHAIWGQITQPITSLCFQETTGHLAIGYKNGLAQVVGADRKAQQLSEHVSPITCIRFNGTHLYTSSMDGSICLWQLNEQTKSSAALVYQGKSWLHTFIISPNGQNIIIGDERGDLNWVVVDPQRMAEEIHKQLQRNFTPEEWNLYIGEVSAYETYLSK